MVKDTVDNLCILLSSREYSQISIGHPTRASLLLKGDEWMRVGEAICSNSKNIQKHSLEITLYPLDLVILYFL